MPSTHRLKPTIYAPFQRFGFETAAVGIRKMLALVWSKEESVKTALLEAYTRMYLESARPEAVAKNLVQVRR